MPLPVQVRTCDLSGQAVREEHCGAQPGAESGRITLRRRISRGRAHLGGLWPVWNRLTAVVRMATNALSLSLENVDCELCGGSRSKLAFLAGAMAGRRSAAVEAYSRKPGLRGEGRSACAR